MGDSDCVRMCPSVDPGTLGGGCTPGAWADYSCGVEYHYVCEIRGCPEGWTAHGDSCYLFVEEQKSQADASAACAEMGATLAHVDDAAENAWLASMLPPLGTDDFWIGATNRDTDGHTAVTSDLAWEGDGVVQENTYSNWFPGEPNNAGGGVNYENGESSCVRMCPFGGSAGYTGGCTRGGWADFPCSTQYRFICERWWNAAAPGEAVAFGGGH